MHALRAWEWSWDLSAWATWPNSLRHLARTISDSKGCPVRLRISEFVTCSDHIMFSMHRRHHWSRALILLSMALVIDHVTLPILYDDNMDCWDRDWKICAGMGMKTWRRRGGGKRFTWFGMGIFSLPDCSSLQINNTVATPLVQRNRSRKHAHTLSYNFTGSNSNNFTTNKSPFTWSEKLRRLGSSLWPETHTTKTDISYASPNRFAMPKHTRAHSTFHSLCVHQRNKLTKEYKKILRSEKSTHKTNCENRWRQQAAGSIKMQWISDNYILHNTRVQCCSCGAFLSKACYLHERVTDILTRLFYSRME